MFRKNGYPLTFLQKIIEKFLNSKNSSEKDETDAELGIFIKIPFIGKKSSEFGKCLSKLFDEHFGIKITPVFTSFKVKTYFRLKSRTPGTLCSNVVYQFTSSCDTSLSYIGVTSRPFCIRIQEHIDCSPKNKVDSAVKKHLNHCQKCFADTRTNGSDHFQIIRQCDTQYDAKIQESLLIKKRNPKLNVQQHNKGASFLLDIF